MTTMDKTSTEWKLNDTAETHQGQDKGNTYDVIIKFIIAVH